MTVCAWIVQTFVLTKFADMVVLCERGLEAEIASFDLLTHTK